MGDDHGLHAAPDRQAEARRLLSLGRIRAGDGATGAAVGALVDAGQIDLISAGEELKAKTESIGDPAILEDMIDRPPKVDSSNFWSIRRRRRGRDRRLKNRNSDSTAKRVLLKTFGKVGLWQPIRAERTAMADPTERPSST